jgi:SAM-dependent methyltransferase
MGPSGCKKQVAFMSRPGAIVGLKIDNNKLLKSIILQFARFGSSSAPTASSLQINNLQMAPTIGNRLKITAWMNRMKSVFGALPQDREAFRIHYETNKSRWGKNSGAGSNPYYTIPYRNFLEAFIWMNRIESIVDVGCGDWQFSRFLNLGSVNYLGLDVVPSIIAKNQSDFAAENINFQVMPQDLSTIPQGDLLIMKDVLQHLPNAAIFEFKEKLFPKFKFVLLTNSFSKLNTQLNVDIKPGEFRCLDLSAAPYSFRGSYVLEFSSPLWERIRTFIYYN